jgi:prepilin-type N-terminal cleavage/methylation domain-containing protein
MFNKQGWFTIVEIMIVILIIGLLATSLFMVLSPYMSRSRDTKRITDILSYTNILDAYDKNFDTFPSNMWSGNNFAIPWYCLTELYTRWATFGDNVNVNNPVNSWRFSALANKDSSTPPVDPIGQIAVSSICPIPWSYIYSRIDYGNGSQLAIVAARVEMRPSGNYGTGSDLIWAGNVQNIIDAKKSTIPDSAPDQLYVVYKLH